MQGAINSTTKKYVYAWKLDLDPSHLLPKEDVWFADPNEILDYDKNKVKDIQKIIVKYREGNESVINWKGTEYAISPCFYIPNKTALGINIIPESKEHKLAKNWIYNRLKKKEMSFIYSSVKRPFEYVNKINVSDLDIDLEKVGIEISVKNNKTQRADIIMPLKKYHSLFGTGIVVEIQFSKQRDSTTEKRNYEWAFKGYSVCWLWFDDFEKISEDFIELKDEKLKLNPLDKILKDFSDKNLFDFGHKTQELSRMIDKKMQELHFPFCIGECKICNRGYMTIQKNRTKGTFFYSCSNWKNGCKHSINIPEGYGQ